VKIPADIAIVTGGVVVEKVPKETIPVAGEWLATHFIGVLSLAEYGQIVVWAGVLVVLMVRLHKCSVYLIKKIKRLAVWVKSKRAK